MDDELFLVFPSSSPILTVEKLRWRCEGAMLNGWVVFGVLFVLRRVWEMRRFL